MKWSHTTTEKALNIGSQALFVGGSIVQKALGWTGYGFAIGTLMEVAGTGLTFADTAVKQHYNQITTKTGLTGSYLMDATNLIGVGGSAGVSRGFGIKSEEREALLAKSLSDKQAEYSNVVSKIEEGASVSKTKTSISSVATPVETKNVGFSNTVGVRTITTPTTTDDGYVITESSTEIKNDSGFKETYEKRISRSRQQEEEDNLNSIRRKAIAAGEDPVTVVNNDPQIIQNRADATRTRKARTELGKAVEAESGGTRYKIKSIPEIDTLSALYERQGELLNELNEVRKSSEKETLEIRNFRNLIRFTAIPGVQLLALEGISNINNYTIGAN